MKLYEKVKILKQPCFSKSLPFVHPFYPLCTFFGKKRIDELHVCSCKYLLLRPSKSISLLFKQFVNIVYFCQNSSNLVDFVTQKCQTYGTLTLTPMDFFLFILFFVLFIEWSTRLQVCYFSAYKKFEQKGWKKGTVPILVKYEEK